LEKVVDAISTGNLSEGLFSSLPLDLDVLISPRAAVPRREARTKRQAIKVIDPDKVVQKNDR
jgi:hypothetical protein